MTPKKYWRKVNLLYNGCAKSSNKPHYIWKTFANKTPETFITAPTSAIKLSQLSALFNYSVHNNIFGRISSSLCSSSTLRATNTWRWTNGCPPCWRRTPWGWCWTLQGTKAPGSTSSPSTNSAPSVTVWVWSVCVQHSVGISDGMTGFNQDGTVSIPIFD